MIFFPADFMQFLLSFFLCFFLFHGASLGAVPKGFMLTGGAGWQRDAIKREDKVKNAGVTVATFFGDSYKKSSSFCTDLGGGYAASFSASSWFWSFSLQGSYNGVDNEEEYITQTVPLQ